MNERGIVITIIVFILLLVGVYVAFQIYGLKKVQLSDGVSIRNMDYTAIEKQFEDYRFVKICDLETKQCAVFTRTDIPKL